MPNLRGRAPRPEVGCCAPSCQTDPLSRGHCLTLERCPEIAHGPCGCVCRCPRQCSVKSIARHAAIDRGRDDGGRRVFVTRRRTEPRSRSRDGKRQVVRGRRFAASSWPRTRSCRIPPVGVWVPIGRASVRVARSSAANFGQSVRRRVRRPPQPPATTTPSESAPADGTASSWYNSDSVAKIPSTCVSLVVFNWTTFGSRFV